MQEFVRQLTPAEQLALRDGFFRKLGRIPENPKKILLYSAVAGELLAKVLPSDILAALKEFAATEYKLQLPLVIQGFKIGYTGLATKGGSVNATVRYDMDEPIFPRRKVLLEKTKLAKHPSNGKLYKATEKPYSALFLAVKSILGGLPGDGRSFTRNDLQGYHDEAHDHENCAMVLGIKGYSEVKTKIWYNTEYDKERITSEDFMKYLEKEVKPDFEVALNTGDLLLIPQGRPHAVDGYAMRWHKWGEFRKVKPESRVTLATFVKTGGHVERFTKAELAAGRKEFLIDRGVGKGK